MQTSALLSLLTLDVLESAIATVLEGFYLVYMKAHGYRNALSLTMFGKGLSAMLKEYVLNYEKRHTNQGMQTNLVLREESNADWLPKCDDPTAT